MPALTALLTRVRSLDVSLEAEGEGIRVNGTSRLPASLLAEVKVHKSALLAYLQSSQRLLDDAGVRVEYADTDVAAAVLLGQVMADAGVGSPIGLDVETYVPPHRGPPPVVKMTRTGAQVTKPKDDKAGLDPHRAQVRLVQIYGGGDTCAVLDMRTVSWAILAPLWARKLVIHNSQFELTFLRAQDIYPEQVECTMQGAGLMLGIHRRSLVKAVAEYLAWQMPKGLQVSDWGAAVLSGDQLAYAALDAVGAFLLWAKLNLTLKRVTGGMRICCSATLSLRLSRWLGAALASIQLRWTRRLPTGPLRWLLPGPTGKRKQGRPRPANQLISGPGLSAAWMRRTWRRGPVLRRPGSWPLGPATWSGPGICQLCDRCYRSGVWRSCCRHLGRA